MTLQISCHQPPQPLCYFKDLEWHEINEENGAPGNRNRKLSNILFWYSTNSVRTDDHGQDGTCRGFLDSREIGIIDMEKEKENSQVARETEQSIGRDISK